MKHTYMIAAPTNPTAIVPLANSNIDIHHKAKNNDPWINRPEKTATAGAALPIATLDEYKYIKVDQEIEAQILNTDFFQHFTVADPRNPYPVPPPPPPNGYTSVASVFARNQQALVLTLINSGSATIYDRKQGDSTWNFISQNAYNAGDTLPLNNLNSEIYVHLEDPNVRVELQYADHFTLARYNPENPIPIPPPPPPP